jgi:hypothetical protein
MPELPAHARYIWHRQPLSCGAWGLLGWLLASTEGDAASGHLRLHGRAPGSYERYILLESSARGPYMPAYMQGLRWSEAFARSAAGWPISPGMGWQQ